SDLPTLRGVIEIQKNVCAGISNHTSIKCACFRQMASWCSEWAERWMLRLPPYSEACDKLTKYTLLGHLNRPNDPATRTAGRVDCNRSAMAGPAAAHG